MFTITNDYGKETDSTILIWGGSCFGACDIPTETEKLGVDFGIFMEKIVLIKIIINAIFNQNNSFL